MQGSFKVGTIGGIAIRVHYTWIFAVLLIAWSLALGYFPSSSQGRGAGTDWLLAIIAALLLFGSVLVHELGHSLVARARGLRVEEITLFIFGGISSIAQEAASAWDEFWSRWSARSSVWRSPACAGRSARSSRPSRS